MVCAYAILSNHTPAVVFVDRQLAQSWNHNEVIERWHGLFSGVPDAYGFSVIIRMVFNLEWPLS